MVSRSSALHPYSAASITKIGPRGYGNGIAIIMVSGNEPPFNTIVMPHPMKGCTAVAVVFEMAFNNGSLNDLVGQKSFRIFEPLSEVICSPVFVWLVRVISGVKRS